MDEESLEKNINTEAGRKRPLGKRLEFIDFRLQWDGQLNRSDLISSFGISTPQASLDISRYNKLAPNNLYYDHKVKSYFSSDTFVPYFESSSIEYYLNELYSIEDSSKPSKLSFVKWKPSVEIIPMPKRVIPSNNIIVILQSIRNEQSIDVEYLSKANIKAVHRRLSPHALVHDGMRWHIRAYCHLKEEFRDFVMARFISVNSTNEPGVAAKRDDVFNNILNLVLIPNPSLSKAHKKVVEFEYGMTDGKLILQCREASFFYILRRFGLSIEERHTDVVQIVLENHDELIKYMPKSKRSLNNE